MDRLYAEIDTIHKNLFENDLDWLHLNCGIEGAGKSTLGWALCKRFDKAFNVNNIAFDNHGWRNLINNARDKTPIMLDEGAEALYAREFQTRDSIDTNKMLMRTRYRNLFLCINIPEMSMIDSYIRNFRARSLTRVVLTLDESTGILNRGKVLFYSWKKIIQIKRDSRTGKTFYPRPDFADFFPKVVSEEWEAYLKAKKDYADTKDEQEDFNIKDPITCPNCLYTFKLNKKKKK